MKTGILTYHRFINYGGLLQAYALKEALKKEGADAEVVDYRCAYLENVGNSDLKDKRISNKRKLWKLAQFAQIRIKERKFGKFISAHLDVSEPYLSIEELAKAADDYDIMITGSDQVWNEKWPYDRAYFLDFECPDSKKTSYAASLGDGGVPKDKEAYYRKCLAPFRAISVREEADREIIKRITGRDDIVVATDPVLLLEKDDWDKVAQRASGRLKKRISHKKYVLIYTVNEPQVLIRRAEAYARKKHLSVVYLNPSPLHGGFWQFGTKIKDASPEDFVFAFKHAEAVFTNSFHGTAFSVIYEKKVFVETDSNGHHNKRAADLLERLGAQDNYIKKYGRELRAVYSKMREESLEYIRKGILDRE